MLSLIPQPSTVACAACGREAVDPSVGLPAGWDGVFKDGDWALFCPSCQPSVDTPVFAVFRPQVEEVALFVGPRLRTCALTLPEARQLHATLGQALRLADNRGGLAG